MKKAVKALKALTQSLLRRANLKLIRLGSNSSRRLGAYESAVMGLLCASQHLRIVVVGANDGKHNDPIYTVVRDFISAHTQMILIEPQTRLHGYIAEHYAFHNDVHILGCAIGGGEEAGTLELHALRPEYWSRAQPDYAKDWPVYRAPTGITSTDRNNVVTWANKHVKRLKDPDAAVESFEVPCRSLLSALFEVGLDTSIDVLQVDAEGFDDIVIYNSDIAQTRPRIVYFEGKTLTAERLAKLKVYLADHGYISLPIGGDVLALGISTQFL